MPPQGSYGRIFNLLDFTNSFEDVTWASTSVDLGEGWFMVSVAEGTLQQVVDEANGIAQFLTAATDDDNVVLASGVYRPSDGDIHTEARYKVADDMLNTAIFSGFTETLVLATPVMPAEFATTTMTYNGTGGMGGLNYDSDATTNDFRALAGDGGAAAGTVQLGSGANGQRANQTITANEYYIARVTIGQSGTVWSRIAHDGKGADGLFLVDYFLDALDNANFFYAIHMCEDRTGAALEFEVDYVAVEAGRNWAV